MDPTVKLELAYEPPREDFFARNAKTFQGLAAAAGALSAVFTVGIGLAVFLGLQQQVAGWLRANAVWVAVGLAGACILAAAAVTRGHRLTMLAVAALGLAGAGGWAVFGGRNPTPTAEAPALTEAVVLRLTRPELVARLKADLGVTFAPVPGTGRLLQTTELTQAQWAGVWPDFPHPPHFAGADLPRESVSKRDAAEYLARLAARYGRPVGLPTLADYTAAAGPAPKSAAGLRLRRGAFDRNDQSPRPAVAPAAGFADLYGNVAEWLDSDGGPDGAEAFGGSYADTAGECGPPAGKSKRVWPPRYAADKRSAEVGFRLALAAE